MRLLPNRIASGQLFVDHHYERLISQLRDTPQPWAQACKLLARLCNESLFNTGIAAQEVDAIRRNWDALDNGVPHVEAHEQNRYRDGAVRLCVVLSELVGRIAVDGFASMSPKAPNLEAALESISRDVNPSFSTNGGYLAASSNLLAVP
jgi:hypothetical protein